MVKISLLVALLLVLVLSEEQFYKKVIHNTDPQAKCIDGSPAGLYLHQGGDTKNFILYFIGGGSCGTETLSGTIENCYKRSKQILGSSNLYPDKIQVGGYMSTDPSKNKFANWTKVLFFYCDGAFHQGNTNAPLKYKDTELYLRGGVITRSHLKWLNTTYHLADADRIMLTGGSAGGIATYLWTNHLRSFVKNPDAVYSIPDSGVFLNIESTKTRVKKLDASFQNLFKISNVDELTPLSTCNNAKKGEQYLCMFLEYSFTSVQGRILLINSEYDAWAIPNALDIKCLKQGSSGETLSDCSSTQLQLIQNYRASYLKFAGNFMQFSKNSIWTISCSQHVYAIYSDFYDVAKQKVPQNTGLSIRDAVERFVFDGQRINSIDAQAWPGNKPCSV